jgi:predicted nuclease with RNAse H fold
MRVIAVDWSGRTDARQAETLWVAEAVDGRLVELRNGRRREEVIDDLQALDGELVVGFDFAFSLPEWWLREQGVTDVRELWRRAPALLRDRPAPFWGAPGSKALPPQRRFRRTEVGLRAKSVFQLAGPGAVGIGSLRGMPHLLELDGFSIWPFDPPGPRRVLEIYPRALTGAVNKGRWASRHAYLERFEGQDPVLLERAAGSEDAFDAAVSALVMAAHVGQIAALEQTSELEGRIWTPNGDAGERRSSRPSPRGSRAAGSRFS